MPMVNSLHQSVSSAYVVYLLFLTLLGTGALTVYFGLKYHPEVMSRVAAYLL